MNAIKTRRWNIMPTLRRNVEIPKVKKVRGDIRIVKDSKFKVSIEPIGFWRRLVWYLQCKKDYQLIPYFIGTAPEVKLIIKSLGRHIPFNFRLYKKEPDGNKTFSMAITKIRTPTYSEIIKLPDLEHEIEHIYYICVWTKTDYGLPGTHKNMMSFTPFERDRISMQVIVALFLTGFGALLTWLFMR